MQYLLKHKADPRLRDKRGFTAIHYAVAGGNQPALEALLQASASCNPSILLAPNPNSTSATYAVPADNQRPQTPALTPLHLAVSINSTVLFIPIYERLTIQSFLQAYHGHGEILRLLLPLFPNTNIKEDTGKTPLDLASYRGHKQCVQLLIRSGAAVSVQVKTFCNILSIVGYMKVVVSCYDCEICDSI